MVAIGTGNIAFAHPKDLPEVINTPVRRRIRNFLMRRCCRAVAAESLYCTLECSLKGSGKEVMATTIVYDVAVIGAGVIGSAAACQIVKAGATVILLDQVPRLLK